MKRTILIVDDEPNILELLKFTLESEGFNVVQAKTGEEALEKLEWKKIDAVVLDLMLPGIDGLEVLKKIRTDQALKNIPVIMLTAKNEGFDRVIGLELGADDYICKPFFVRELVARIKVLFRRMESLDTDPTKSYSLKYGDILIDEQRHTVKKDKEKIDLTLKEFELLCLLLKNIGKVLTREEILTKIWGFDYTGETRTVDVHIRQIRKKLGDEDEEKRNIITVRGIGYKWRDRDD